MKVVTWSQYVGSFIGSPTLRSEILDELSEALRYLLSTISGACSNHSLYYQRHTHRHTHTYIFMVQLGVNVIMQLFVLLLLSGSRNEKVNNFPYVDIAVEMYHVRVAYMTSLPCHCDKPCPLGDSCVPCLFTIHQQVWVPAIGMHNCTTHIHVLIH